MKSKWQDIGIFLKVKREESGFTQKQISDQFKLKSTQFVSNWERGLCLPPLDYLPTICQLYKIEKQKLIKQILLINELELESIFSSSNKKVKKIGNK